MLTNDTQNSGFNFVKNTIRPFAAVAFIKIVYLFGASHLFGLKEFFNWKINNKNELVNRLSNDPCVAISAKSKVMFSVKIPKNNNYPNKCVLLIGGRNSFHHNYLFARDILNEMNITTVTFQFDGYYGSGLNSEITEESYMNSAIEAYIKASKYGEVYIVGYSMGCYAAYSINKRKSVFLITPFLSVQSVTRGEIPGNNLNLRQAILSKPVESVIIRTFTLDILTPSSHLKEIFGIPYVKHISGFGNHASGMTSSIFLELKEYINS